MHVVCAKRARTLRGTTTAYLPATTQRTTATAAAVAVSTAAAVTCWRRARATELIPSLLCATEMRSDGELAMRWRRRNWYAHTRTSTRAYTHTHTYTGSRALRDGRTDVCCMYYYYIIIIISCRWKKNIYIYIHTNINEYIYAYLSVYNDDSARERKIWNNI